MNKKFKMISILFVVAILLVTSFFYPSNLNRIVAQENQLEEQIENSMINELPSEIEVENVEFSILNQEIDIQAKSNNENISINFDLNSDSALNLSESSLSMTIESEEEDLQQYSLFFGTLEQKVNYDKAIQKDEMLIESISENLGEIYDEVLTEDEIGEDNVQEVNHFEELNSIDSYVLETEKMIESGELVISSVQELEDSPIVVTDLNTGEVFEVDQTDGVASLIFAIPAGIAITTVLGKTLISTGVALVVGGSIVINLAKVSTDARIRNKKYNHYKVLKFNNKLYSGGGISQKAAVSRMALGIDVWSTSQSGAKTVASTASLNLGGSKTPIGPERDNNKAGYYRHYHTNPRKNSKGHSFYGGPS